MSRDIVLTEKDKERFLAKVDRRGPDECWPWLAYTRSGYGRMAVGRNLESAHYIAYVLDRGEQPKGKKIYHTCPGGERRDCCNPRHLVCSDVSPVHEAIKASREAAGDLGSGDIVLGEHDIKRFLSKVDRQGPDECWLWLGNKYGGLRVGDTKFQAHRIAYFLATGEQPGDSLISKKCFEPLCCNPAHLVRGEVTLKIQLLEAEREMLGDVSPDDLVMTPSDSKRFWPKIDRRGVDECWPWAGSRDTSGYGYFYLWGKVRKATRVMYAATCGSPGDLDVLHTCDNPPCCNPKHLWLGTNDDNVADCIAKGRKKTGKRATPDEVIEMRRLHKLGHLILDIAGRFKKTRHCVSDIVNYKSYKDLP